MKKTILIATLALGLGSACAAESAITLPDLAYTNTNISGALSVSGTFSGASNTFTMVAVYDYNTLLDSAIEHGSDDNNIMKILTITQSNGTSTRDIAVRSASNNAYPVFRVYSTASSTYSKGLENYTEDKLVLLLSQDASNTTLYYLTPESGSTAASLTSLGSITGTAGLQFTSLSSMDGYGLESLYVYKGAMNGNEMLAAATAAYTAAVPEPATATLSLLALAGIAARRRRK